MKSNVTAANSLKVFFRQLWDGTLAQTTSQALAVMPDKTACLARFYDVVVNYLGENKNWPCYQQTLQWNVIQL